MLESRRGKIIVAIIAVILVATGVTWWLILGLLGDRYLDQPRVVGLPPGYDPMAPRDPYSGEHPALQGRPADPYAYPIPIGDTGPVKPTYTDDLEYPYACRSEGSDLGQPLVDNQEGAGTAVYLIDDFGNKTDEIIGYSRDCSLPTAVLYYYHNTASGEFEPYNSASTNVEMLSINGEQVPFVVRLEVGTINRHIYVIAMLRGPADAPRKPDLAYWNRKLIYQLRGGVGIGRRQGRIPMYYIPDRNQGQLRLGYAVAYSTANQTSNSYDVQLAEDTLARVKRQFMARYGEPLYTVGIGGSGGALQQYLIGQNRPGLLDAGIALYSYPDMVTQISRVMDCELLEYYFDVTDVENPKWQSWSQRSWIEGFNARDDGPNVFNQLRAVSAVSRGEWPTWSDGNTECTKSWRNLTPQIANPNYTYFASLFAPDVRRQVSWTYWDNLKNVFGTDEHGHALRTYDNVGVQYGLRALQRGQITIAEFLKLNANIGGWKAAVEMAPERFWRSGGGESDLADMSIWSHQNMTNDGIDGKPAPRSDGNLQAMAAAYRSGQVFLGELSMPIIDFRHYLEPELDMHHSKQSFSARLRLQRRQGHAENQVIWSSRKPYTPLPEAFDVLDRWVMNMRTNPDLGIAKARPEDAIDRCYNSAGELIASGDGVWDGIWNDKDNGECMSTYPIFSNPRIVAGDDYVGDIFKCHLQSVDDAIAKGLYAPFDVSEYRDDLQQIFPTGVCDYSLGDASRPPDLIPN